MTLCDAHNHLQDARLAPYRTEIEQDLQRAGLRGAVVNGTRQDDWEAVAALAEAHPWITPAFGLHPWWVSDATSSWPSELDAMLDRFPRAGVGEVGLDRWVRNHDLPLQQRLFSAQLAIAAARNCHLTIHCLKAWGALWDIIRTEPVPTRGFLLHSYGGPAEMIGGFVDRGAYFSFSAYFLHECKATQRTLFRQIPLERLLVETDAPDMLPPSALNKHPLPPGVADTQLNHPANITLAYHGLAETLEMPVEALAERIAQNFQALFGA